MEQRELTRLKTLTAALVKGRPVLATVDYDQRSGRLTLRLQSAPNSTANRWASRECSPTVMDHADLDAYLRHQISAFVAQMED